MRRAFRHNSNDGAVCVCYNIGMYIEFVIADNFLLTYLAGATATRLCHNKVRVMRVLLASTIGTVVAVFYPFMRGGTAAQLSVKLALWITLSAVMYLKTPRALTASVVFLGCTFAFGGASFALGLMLYSDISQANAFSTKCPLFLVLGTSSIVYLGIRYCIKRLRLPRARAPYEYGTEIEVYGESMKFAAFLDTGNCVFDGTSGLPVVITDVDMFTSKLNGGAAIEFAKRLPKLRRISASTPAGVADIILVQPTRITVYSDRRGHTINAMVGLVSGTGKRFSPAHEMLLNPAVMTEGVV